MSTNPFEANSAPLAWEKVLKPSHRTRPEQCVGLSIYLLICLGFEFLSRFSPSLPNTVYFICLALSMWTLWRRYSLLLLKIELFVFLSQFLFQMAWSGSFFVLQEKLLSLVALLLLGSNTLLAALLFRKRERLSGILLLFPLIWIFYLAGLNMIACISNP